MPPPPFYHLRHAILIEYSGRNEPQKTKFIEPWTEEIVPSLDGSIRLPCQICIQSHASRIHHRQGLITQSPPYLFKPHSSPIFSKPRTQRRQTNCAGAVGRVVVRAAFPGSSAPLVSLWVGRPSASAGGLDSCKRTKGEDDLFSLCLSVHFLIVGMRKNCML